MGAIRFEHGAVFIGYPPRAVQHEQQHVGFCYRVLGSTDAFAFDPVLRLSQACRIEQAQGDPPDVQGFIDDVAGRAGLIRYDRAVQFQQRIEQARFTHVGPADDGDFDAFPNQAAFLIGRDQPLHCHLRVG